MFNIELLQNLAKSRNKSKINFIDLKIPEFQIKSIINSNFDNHKIKKLVENDAFLSLKWKETEIFNPEVIKYINDSEVPYQRLQSSWESQIQKLVDLYLFSVNNYNDKNEFEEMLSSSSIAFGKIPAQ